MIDQARLDAIRLSPRPLGQRIMGALILGPNYGFPLRPTRIVLEGREHLPRSGGAVLVMNHTDRYNYWPFQYQLHQEGFGYTATWVKGKYYENALMGRFMDATNNIPVPSRGYLITKDFQALKGRAPDEREYAALKRFCDGQVDRAQAAAAGGPAVAELIDHRGATGDGDWRTDIAARFRAMMVRVVEINREALAMGHSLLIFPQGTRSVRLTRGHTGAAQIALYTGAPVIPVGCNGADRCYPGDLPLSRGGTIVYRVGAPLTQSGALAPFQAALGGRPFMPFTADAEPHAATFQAMTDLMMDRINELLDPEYQYGPEDQQARGAQRFV